MFPFRTTIKDGQKIDIIGCEPASCPSFTKGKYAMIMEMWQNDTINQMHSLGSIHTPTNHLWIRYRGCLII